MKKICIIGCHKITNYLRAQNLYLALKSNKRYKAYLVTNKSSSIKRYLEVVWGVIKIRLSKNPDIYILAFRGYELFPIIRFLTIGKALIFDEFMTIYDNLYKSKSYKKGFFESGIIPQPLIKLAEKTILKLSNQIITDTPVHKDHIIKSFEINEYKVDYIVVGSDKRIFKPLNIADKQNEKLTIFTYGTLLPLHGWDVILKAVNELKELDLELILVGGKGKETKVKEFQQLITELKLEGMIKHMNWIQYEALPMAIARADVCLGGPFGKTDQGTRVITGKTYQFLSMGKPTIIGKIKWNPGFVDYKNCLLVKQGDYKDLAEKIRWAYNNRGKLDIIGKNAYILYNSQFSNDQIKVQLHKVLTKLIKT